ncbi:MAG: glycoside hydrolase family 127 protein, partial [Prevotellaceae bacterium]|nr:glycoside hydrolase family 127 protein [Prevotellaceae bacterium]
AANKGLVALEYGALVYCAEEADNSRFDEVSINGQTSCLVEKKPDLLDGICVIRGGGSTFIPYYAWSNRGEGKMKVWFNAAQP